MYSLHHSGTLFYILHPQRTAAIMYSPHLPYSLHLSCTHRTYCILLHLPHTMEFLPPCTYSPHLSCTLHLPHTHCTYHVLTAPTTFCTYRILTAPTTYSLHLPHTHTAPIMYSTHLPHTAPTTYCTHHVLYEPTTYSQHHSCIPIALSDTQWIFSVVNTFHVLANSFTQWPHLVLIFFKRSYLFCSQHTLQVLIAPSMNSIHISYPHNTLHILNTL